MNHSRMHSDATAAGRRAFREIVVTIAFALALLAILLVVAVVAGHTTTAVAAAVAFVLAFGAAAVVFARARRVVALRDEAIEEERTTRDQLDQTLGATRRLFEIDGLGELRREICATARDVFACAGAALWEVEHGELHLLDRVPWIHPYTGGDLRPLAEIPGLAATLDGDEPLFLADLRLEAAGVTRAVAEIAGSASMLAVPVALGPAQRMLLALTWAEERPRPAPALRTAAQRFADQAGMALEQARYRSAQAEIASLNRTLGRMVQTDPLFRAGGTVDEVAHAICSEALAIFEADGAALWADAGDGIELLRREPSVGPFSAHQHIAFAEHPSFREDLEGGQPRFLADVELEEPVLWERFARHSGSRSQLRLPLASGGAARALIVLSWTNPVPPPSAEVSAIASRFADQAGVALAEAARREAAREAGELHARFEESLLPSIALRGRDASIATFYRPGDERLTLGGDFYDALELDDGAVVVLVGDVAGHGPAAAALGAGLRSAWRALVLSGLPLEEVLRGLQAVCVRERDDPYRFVTAVTARLAPDRSALHVVSAGHPAPLVRGGAAPDLPEHGPPLGVVADGEWRGTTVPLARPATVLLYTDGLVEGRAAPGSTERLGIAPIERLLAQSAPGAVGEDDLRRLVEFAAGAHGTGLPDDVALLALNVGA